MYTLITIEARKDGELWECSKVGQLRGIQILMKNQIIIIARRESIHLTLRDLPHNLASPAQIMRAWGIILWHHYSPRGSQKLATWGTDSISAGNHKETG
jgi:16S rRNA G1207 methylase RsmC